MTFIFGSDLPVGETAEKDKMIWPGWRGCGTGMTLRFPWSQSFPALEMQVSSVSMHLLFKISPISALNFYIMMEALNYCPGLCLFAYCYVSCLDSHGLSTSESAITCFLS